MIISSSEKIPLEKCPALVLNADFRPLSYYPLSLWCWQDAVKSVFLNRVSIVSRYKRKVRSPSFEMELPSVIALKSFIKPSENPNFTRFNVFLRDKFTCQYCGDKKDLTFDLHWAGSNQTTDRNRAALAMVFKTATCQRNQQRFEAYQQSAKPFIQQELRLAEVVE